MHFYCHVMSRYIWHNNFPLSFRLTLYNRYIPAVDNSLTILLLQTNRQEEEEVKQCCLHFDHPIQEEEAKREKIFGILSHESHEEEEED